MIRRTDNGSLDPSQAARSTWASLCRRPASERPSRKPGVTCEIAGILGTYTAPRRLILYTSDGEVRQEFLYRLDRTPGFRRADQE